MAGTLTLCLVQTQLTWERPSANCDHMAQVLDDAGEVDLIILPEMFSTGFSMNSAALAETMQGETVSWMLQLARDKQAAVCGSLIIVDGADYYNRFILASPSGQLHTYDKRHLFRMSTENDHYSPGRRRVSLQAAGFELFPQICYDLRFPVFSRNDLGFDAIIYVANWPAARRDHWRALLVARAIENQSYVVGVNRIGTDGNGVAYAGDSMAVNFDGRVLLDMANTNGTACISLDRAALMAYRGEFPAWKDADPFDLQGLP